MKRHICIFSLFCLLLNVYSQDANAQFWKRIFGKDEPKRKSVPRKPAQPEKQKQKPPAPKVELKKNMYPATVMKERYRVDVLLPLYLDELVVDGKSVSKGKLPEKAEQGMEFYEGIKLAADTLTQAGYNIDVYIHDIADPNHWPEALTRRGQLGFSDLIIGLVQSQHIPILAEYAEKEEVNFISALSPSDADIKTNPYYILMQPSLQAHCRLIRERIEQKYKRQHPVLYYRNSVSVDKEAYTFLSKGKTDFREVSCNSQPDRQQLVKLFDSTEKNVIVMGILDNSYAERLLTQLYTEFPEYDFEVYGMPSWRSLSGLRKAEAYPNVAVTFTSPFYFDGTTASGNALSNAYKKLYGGTKPGELVYRGYETLYWFAYLLDKYGTIFNEKIKDNGIAPFTRYDVSAAEDENGNFRYLENKHAYFYRYQGGFYSVD